MTRVLDWAKSSVRDGVTNILASLGANTNNIAANSFYDWNPISRDRLQLEYAYRGSWIVKMAVDAVAEDMTREGVDLGSDLEPELGDEIQLALLELHTWDLLCDAIKWARLYGGSLAVMLIDGQNPATPLRLDRVRPGQFKGLMVLDRWMVQPTLSDTITDLGPDLGMPKFYRLAVTDQTHDGGQAFHHSRCIRLNGADLPYFQQQSENGWAMSVLEPVMDRILAFDSATVGAGQMIFKAYLRTYKVEGLRDIIGAGGPQEAGLRAQLQFMRDTQTNEGITMMDTTDEYETHQYQFGGIADIIYQFGQQLSGATGVPLVRMFGQAPQGLNSTGEFDLKNYYDTVRTQQRRRLRRGVNTILSLMAASMGIVLPKDFHWDFTPLWQQSQAEKAQTAQVVTTTVVSAMQAGVVSPQTALKELKQQARTTGVWTNITPQDINDADEELPPSPAELAAQEASEPTQGKNT